MSETHEKWCIDGGDTPDRVMRRQKAKTARNAENDNKLATVGSTAMVPSPPLRVLSSLAQFSVAGTAG